MFKTFRIIALTQVFTLCMALLPITQAHAASDPLRTADGAVVTRGDFIRGAVQVLNISTNDEKTVLPYMRVASALTPFVIAAHKKGALKVFGDDLLLAQGITRGDALFVVAKLGGFRSMQTKTDYTDVPSGSDLENAVAMAIENNWMAPVRDNIFGARRMLIGKDANLLLRKVRGDDVPTFEPQTEDMIESAPKIRYNIQTQPRASTPLPKSQILEALWELINKEYLYEDRIDPDNAAYAAAEAIMKTLDDPYTTFMRPVTSRNFQSQIRGEISGIGAQVEQKDGYLTIVAPITGSPAEDAGLLPGDRVLEVDGVDLVPLGFLDAVEHVRGKRGSTAKLLIWRNGSELTVNVKRDTISVPEIIITWNGNVAIVKLVQFGRLTETELRGQVAAINTKGAKGLILDLRNNPGGLLDAASVVMSNFVPKGTSVARILSRLVTRTEKTTEDPTLDASVPMVVLINGGSASASEIVAGSLQDAKRAIILGQRSFGKGTVQQVIQFNDQSAFKMTIAEWLTPDGRKINGDGVHPDIEILEGDRDEQLSRALELLR
ncbi:MAG: S41 family peptidase [bacterium]|nr:S41 family peptidase [bacterium]